MSVMSVGNECNECWCVWHTCAMQAFNVGSSLLALRFPSSAIQRHGIRTAPASQGSQVCVYMCGACMRTCVCMCVCVCVYLCVVIGTGISSVCIFVCVFGLSVWCLCVHACVSEI